MREFTKKLAIAAAAGTLMTGIGAAWAQSDLKQDANDTPQTAADAQNSNHILHFRNQGNSPETDPAAHLILIHDGYAPVASTESSTTVAAASPAPVDNTPAATTPDTSASSTDNSTSTSSTDTTNATTDNSAAAMPAPRADRN